MEPNLVGGDGNLGVGEKAGSVKPFLQLGELARRALQVRNFVRLNVLLNIGEARKLRVAERARRRTARQQLVRHHGLQERDRGLIGGLPPLELLVERPLLLLGVDESVVALNRHRLQLRRELRDFLLRVRLLTLSLLLLGLGSARVRGELVGRDLGGIALLALQLSISALLLVECALQVGDQRRDVLEVVGHVIDHRLGLALRARTARHGGGGRA